MMSQCVAWLWANKLPALVLARFVAAEAVVGGIVRMAVVVVAAGCMAEAAEAAEVAVDMVRKVS